MWRTVSAIRTPLLAGAVLAGLAGLVGLGACRALGGAGDTISVRGAAERAVHIELTNRERAALRKQVAALWSKLARKVHVKAANTKDVGALETADDLYRLYIEAFPDAGDIVEMRYFYTEVLVSRAENEHDPRHRAELWDRFAREYDAAVAAGFRPSVPCTIGWSRPLDISSPPDSVRTLGTPREPRR
jgi:hypothetical protein